MSKILFKAAVAEISGNDPWARNVPEVTGRADDALIQESPEVPKPWYRIAIAWNGSHPKHDIPSASRYWEQHPRPARTRKAVSQRFQYTAGSYQWMLRFIRRVLTKAMSTSQPPDQPLVAIVGATGTGKSDLAVELALRFNGEIINADAVQMYEGLPIITNKIPVEERKGVAHHLLGSIGLEEPTWTVKQFLPKALEIIEEIRGRQKLPIIVGGTHYYIQSLLLKDHTIESESNGQAGAQEDYDRHPILKESNAILLQRLREVDPVIANRWHPNDRRRLQRSLQIFLETGKPASKTYLERLEAGPAESSSLRYPSSLILWSFCEREKHKQLLDARVDKMVDTGLLHEIAQLFAIRETQRGTGGNVDFTKGIWQSIGFRQFEQYHESLTAGTAEPELAKLKDEATKQTQAATRRYAASQLKWLRIKLVNALVRAGARSNLLVLDATVASDFKHKVIQPALDLTELFLAGKTLPDAKSICAYADALLTPTKEDLTQSPQSWGVKECEVCGTKAATPHLWEMHLKSRGHKMRTQKIYAREGSACSREDKKAQLQNTVLKLP